MKQIKKTFILFFSIFNLVCLAGQLDVSFNPNGKKTGTKSTKILNFSEIKSLYTDKNDNIVAGGYAFEDNSKFAIARYKSDGSLDLTFNPNKNFGPKKGIIVTNIGISSSISSVAKFGDKIIAVGTSRENQDALEQLTLARYNSDGSLDQAFNKNNNLGPSKGIVIPNLWLTSFAGAVLVKKKNIYVCGSIWNPSFGHEIALLKFKNNGTLDDTFNSNGQIPGVFSKPITNVSRALAIALDSQNRILIGGYSELGLTLLRCKVDGTLDTTFADDGVFSILIGQTQNSLPDIKAIALDSQERIYLVAKTTRGFTLLRLKNDGTLDESFNANGKKPGLVITKINDSAQSFDLVLDQNEKIIINGLSTINNATQFTLAKYKTNGKLDKKSFNPNGQKPGTVNTKIGLYSSSFASVLKNNKIIVAGSSNSQFTLARYLN